MAGARAAIEIISCSLFPPSKSFDLSADFNEGHAMSMAIGGFVIASDGSRDQLEPIVCPNDDDVRKSLNRVARSGGVVDLRHQPAPDEGPYKLVL
jgi:hypothetical protein